MGNSSLSNAKTVTIIFNGLPYSGIANSDVSIKFRSPITSGEPGVFGDYGVSTQVDEGADFEISLWEGNATFRREMEAFFLAQQKAIVPVPGRLEVKNFSTGEHTVLPEVYAGDPPEIIYGSTQKGRTYKMWSPRATKRPL